MSDIFKGLGTEGLEESSDRLGGFAPLETDIYTGPIKVAYAGASTNGARNVTLIVDHDGKEYRETIYITNRKGENWFNPKDGNGKLSDKKAPLPGFTTIDDICLVTTDKPLSEQDTAEKVVNVYDPEHKKEMPKSVPVLIELTGKIVSLAIVKNLENKSTKVGEDYIASAETRSTNTIEKVFQTATKLTVAEARDGKETATFYDAWLERNKGKERDKRTVKDGAGGTPGRPGQRAPSGPPQASGAAPARKSLFGAKAAS